jgi:hypothetical protein
MENVSVFIMVTHNYLKILSVTLQKMQNDSV